MKKFGCGIFTLTFKLYSKVELKQQSIDFIKRIWTEINVRRGKSAFDEPHRTVARDEHHSLNGFKSKQPRRVISLVLVDER